MPTAYVHLPFQVHYRREAFINGCARLGYIVVQDQPSVPLEPDDIAIIWNKTARSRKSIEAARRGGGALIVVENGYCGTDAEGRQPYAMALDGHNGSGRWYAPPTEFGRLYRLGLDCQRTRYLPDSKKVVIAGQRGIGSPEMRSPPEFASSIEKVLRREGFDTLIRPHPGTKPPATSLLDDLTDARCLVVWSSNCATAALIAGVPTFYCAPRIVTAGAAVPFTPSLDIRPVFARGLAFQRMSWAQWFLDEIESGEAIETLMLVHSGRHDPCMEGLGL